MSLTNRVTSFLAFANSLANHGLDLPTVGDIFRSVRMLLRLQKFYELRTDDLSLGIVAGIEASGPLEPRNLLDVGQQAQEAGLSDTAIHWLKAVHLQDPKDPLQCVVAVGAKSDLIKIYSQVCMKVMKSYKKVILKVILNFPVYGKNSWWLRELKTSEKDG